MLKDYDNVRRDMERLLGQGTDQNALRETIIQAYLFDGYPVMFEGLFLLREILGKENAPPPPEALDRDTLDSWVACGEKLCRRIYGNNFDRMQENMRTLSPDVANWMVVEGYGKVLSREGLDVRTRELINVAVLAAKDYPRQLHSHLLGALNVGVLPEEVNRLLELLEPLAPENIQSSRRLWKSIIERQKDNNRT